MRVHHQHGGAVVGHHQFFNQHTGKVAFAAACAGKDGKVGAREAAHIQRNGHGVGRAAEQAAQEGAAHLPLLRAAEGGGEVGILGNVDGRAALWRHARVDELAHSRVVIAEHGDCQLKKLIRGTFVAQQRGQLCWGDERVGHEGIGEDLDSLAPCHAAQNAPFDAVGQRAVVDELAVRHLAIGVGRNKGELVGCFAWPLDNADGLGGRDFGCAHRAGSTMLFHARLLRITVSARVCWGKCGVRRSTMSMSNCVTMGVRMLRSTGT